MLKVGKYYELSIDGERKIIFAVLYGFERGKNKDVYSIRIMQETEILNFR